MKDTLNNFYKYTNLKIIYFLNSAALAAVQPFISIYLHHFKSIKPSVIGTITCLIPFLSFISSPILTGIADKYNQQRKVLIISCIITTIALILLIPIDDNLIGIFMLIALYSISNAPITPLIDASSLKEMGADSQLYGMQRLFAAISYGLIAFITGIIIENHTINFIFILYAIWMFVFLAYYIYNQTNIISKFKGSSFKRLKEDSLELNKDENLKEDDVDLNSGCELIQDSKDSNSVQLDDNINDGLLGNKQKIEQQQQQQQQDDIDLIPIEIQQDDKINNNNDRLPASQVYLNVLKDMHMMIFLFAVMICGMTANIIGNFLFLFLKDVKHASSLLLGSTMPFTVVMELPFFFFGKQLLTLVGVNKLIIVGHCAFILRLSLYNIISIDSVSPWFVLPIEILHGIAFATIWTAGVELSNQMAPKGYETTYQGIFAGTFGGLGAGLGSIIGGFLYEHKSPMFLFRFTAITTTFSLIVFSLNQLYYSNKKKKEININNK